MSQVPSAGGPAALIPGNGSGPGIRVATEKNGFSRVFVGLAGIPQNCQFAGFRALPPVRDRALPESFISRPAGSTVMRGVDACMTGQARRTGPANRKGLAVLRHRRKMRNCRPALPARARSHRRWPASPTRPAFVVPSIRRRQLPPRAWRRTRRRCSSSRRCRPPRCGRGHESPRGCGGRARPSGRCRPRRQERP